MYLLKHWFRKKFPFKDYEKAIIDPDPIIEKRKRLLKQAQEEIRNNIKKEILIKLLYDTNQQDNSC
ncbi:MAG: hypothetical protein PHF29_02535 [Candidatus Riflebacteria bacterium]|nr:hypothetical protein [Candidatus Riflebacteria bacterium]